MPTHTERRHLPYTDQQLFDIVADVEKYPEFIPWFVVARVRSRHGNVLEVEQTVRFAGLRTSFATRAALDPPRRIVIATTDAPFRTFDQTWTFARAGAGGTIVTYESALELRSSVVQLVMRAFFDERETAAATVRAFARRAQQLYGPPPVPSSGSAVP